MMLCHQCQTHYNYPKKCSQCGNEEIQSVVGGIDDLSDQVMELFGEEPLRYDEEKITKKRVGNSPIALTTRIYDPLIPYSDYNQIIFIHAENLFASPDYQVLEESMRQIAQLFHELSPDTSVFFDTKVPNDSFFSAITKLNDNLDIKTTQWYSDFLNTEAKNRDQFQFPPFHNVILFTTQEKKKDISKKVIDGVYFELERISAQIKGTTVTAPYEARFLKRKGMYSYHTLLRYPRQFRHFVALRKAINELSDRFNVQVRLNPRHLF
jgi:primosomal protein N' (replication factor Y)